MSKSIIQEARRLGLNDVADSLDKQSGGSDSVDIIGHIMSEIFRLVKESKIVRGRTEVNALNTPLLLGCNEGIEGNYKSL